MAITINGTTGLSGVDGSAGTPALQGSDSNTGISFGTDEVNINTGGSTRAMVDSSGRVGIGTTSPQEELHIASTEPTLRLEDTDHVAYAQINAAAGNLRFDTDNGNQEANSITSFRIDGSEKMRIDSSGRLLVGTSSDDGRVSLFQIVGNTGGNTGAQISLNRGAIPTAVNQTIGLIAFGDGSGDTYAEIKSQCDGAAAAGDAPGRLVFSTTADGASSPTERLRITSAGNVGIDRKSVV